MRRLAILLLLVGCGESATERATPPGTRSLAPAEELPAAIGWDHVPAPASTEAVAANAEAMRVHGHALGAPADEARRVYEGSVLAFQRVAAMHPDYLDARFNHACALARLERVDEALHILRALLAADLPTFGPRLDAEPDLAPLTGTPGFAQLTEDRQALTERYLQALGDGLPVMYLSPILRDRALSEDEDDILRRAYQAGVWLARERRFVPMGPLIVRSLDALSADLARTVAVLDRAHRAVVQLVGTGSWSDTDPIDHGTLVVLDAATGRERARLASRRPDAVWTPPVEAHATDTGIAVRFGGDTESATFHGAFDDSVRPRLVLGPSHASVMMPRGSLPAGVVLEEDALVLGDQRVALPSTDHVVRTNHATRYATSLPRGATGAWLLTSIIERTAMGDLRAGPVALSAVSVEGGVLSVILVDSLHAGGVGALVAAPDGTAYAQLGRRVVQLTEDGAGESLPEGLYLVPPNPGTY